MTEQVFSAEVLETNARTGRRRRRPLKLSIEARPLYEAMVAAGCHLESEVIAAGQVFSSINNGTKDIAVRTTENGASMQRAMVDMMIGEPWK